MAEGFRNWSGSIDFTPTRHVEPTDEDEVREIVRQTAESGRTLRPVGRGHSSMPLMETEHTLMSLRNMRGVVSYSRERMEAEVLPGTFIRELGQELHREGLATENMGDVDFQAVAGAVGTGTHGTGRRFGNLSTLVTGVRMVTADGGVVDWHQDTHPELMRSARVSLGRWGSSPSSGSGSNRRTTCTASHGAWTPKWSWTTWTSWSSATACSISIGIPGATKPRSVP